MTAPAAELPPDPLPDLTLLEVPVCRLPFWIPCGPHVGTDRLCLVQVVTRDHLGTPTHVRVLA